MKICFVYHFYPHYRSGFIKSVIERFPDSFWVSSGMDGLEGIKGVDPRELGGRATQVGYFTFLGKLYQKGLIDLIRRERFEVVVFLANPNFVSTWVAAIVVRLLGVRVIFWGHGILDPRLTFKNVVRSTFFALADACYFYGYRAKANVARYPWVRQDNVHVGFNSLDYDNQLSVRNNVAEMAEVRTRGKLGRRDCIRLVCISRLTKKCEYELLVAAVAEAQRSRSCRFEIVFIGDGPERSALENQAKRNNVAASFQGAVYDEPTIGRYIYEADAVVSPGKVGLTAMHALMYGTPVITHNFWPGQMPEVEAVVEGKTGFFFEQGNLDSLKNALLALSEIDNEQRDTVRKACFRMIDEIYNPINQVRILADAISGRTAVSGDDAFRILGG